MSRSRIHSCLLYAGLTISLSATSSSLAPLMQGPGMPAVGDAWACDEEGDERDWESVEAGRIEGNAKAMTLAGAPDLDVPTTPLPAEEDQPLGAEKSDESGRESDEQAGIEGDQKTVPPAETPDRKRLNPTLPLPAEEDLPSEEDRPPDDQEFDDGGFDTFGGREAPVLL